MKRIISFIFLLSLMVAFTGCEDFLEKNPQGELTQTSFPISESDALLATNAAYSTLKNWHFHSGGFPILDIMSDDSHKGSNPNDQLPTLGPYDNFEHNPTQDGLDRWWNTLYEGIKRTNVVIEKVDLIDMNQELKERYIAEAHFLRGLYYFDLVRAFGGVPLVTTTNPPIKLERSTAGEIYALVEEDFKHAASVLPEKSQQKSMDIGRATRGAAKAFLAKMYLFKKDYVNAEKYALEVINSEEYGLEEVFSDANGILGENGIESVFEIGALEESGGETAGNQYANTQGVRGTPNRGWGFSRPSLDLRYSFETNDPRLDATIIDLGEVLDGVEIKGDGTTPDEEYDDSGNLVQVECYNQKVWTPGNTTITQWGHNRRLIRYADVLLMAAEALNENNKQTEALIYLEQVRKRAREGNTTILPEITETDQQALHDHILTERRHELAMEGHRFWDLVRTGKANEILGPLGFTSNKNEVLPIPQNEIDISQGSITQNPNY